MRVGWISTLNSILKYSLHINSTHPSSFPPFTCFEFSALLSEQWLPLPILSSPSPILNAPTNPLNPYSDLLLSLFALSRFPLSAVLSIMTPIPLKTKEMLFLLRRVSSHLSNLKWGFCCCFFLLFPFL